MKTSLRALNRTVCSGSVATRIATAAVYNLSRKTTANRRRLGERVTKTHLKAASKYAGFDLGVWNITAILGDSVGALVVGFAITVNADWAKFGLFSALVVRGADDFAGTNIQANLSDIAAHNAADTTALAATVAFGVCVGHLSASSGISETAVREDEGTIFYHELVVGTCNLTNDGKSSVNTAGAGVGRYCTLCGGEDDVVGEVKGNVRDDVSGADNYELN